MNAGTGHPFTEAGRITANAWRVTTDTGQVVVMLIPCVGPGGRAAWIREFTLVSGQLRGGRPGSPACAKDTGEPKAVDKSRSPICRIGHGSG